MKQLFVCICFLVVVHCGYAQSATTTIGLNQALLDLSYFKPIRQSDNWTSYGRLRSQYNYPNISHFFARVHLNRTLIAGFGPSVIAQVSTLAAGCEAGVHYRKSHGSFFVYSVISVEVRRSPQYFSFSIFRFSPQLTPKLKLYSVLGMFFRFSSKGYNFSVIRSRIGVKGKAITFGVTMSLIDRGTMFDIAPIDPGVFVSIKLNRS